MKENFNSNIKSNIRYSWKLPYDHVQYCDIPFRKIYFCKQEPSEEEVQRGFGKGILYITPIEAQKTSEIQLDLRYGDSKQICTLKTLKNRVLYGNKEELEALALKEFWKTYYNECDLYIMDQLPHYDKNKYKWYHSETGQPLNCEGNYIYLKQENKLLYISSYGQTKTIEIENLDEFHSQIKDYLKENVTDEVLHLTEQQISKLGFLDYVTHNNNQKLFHFLEFRPGGITSSNLLNSVQLNKIQHSTDQKDFYNFFEKKNLWGHNSVAKSKLHIGISPEDYTPDKQKELFSILQQAIIEETIEAFKMNCPDQLDYLNRDDYKLTNRCLYNPITVYIPETADPEKILQLCHKLNKAVETCKIQEHQDFSIDLPVTNHISFRVDTINVNGQDKYVDPRSSFKEKEMARKLSLNSPFYNALCGFYHEDKPKRILFYLKSDLKTYLEDRPLITFTKLRDKKEKLVRECLLPAIQCYLEGSEYLGEPINLKDLNLLKTGFLGNIIKKYNEYYEEIFPNIFPNLTPSPTEEIIQKLLDDEKDQNFEFFRGLRR